MRVRPWLAPAKLNLCLRILRRRDDGYHELQTAYQFIDLVDRLGFEPRSDGAVRRSSDLASIAPDDDLVVRAAKLLRSDASVAAGVDIHLDKTIPIGAGLGGGSSDAATTLVALNTLWGLHWPRRRLAELGATLGADVPVFVLGHAAWGEGIGERLTPTEFPEAHYIVLVPPVQVPTNRVFAAVDLTAKRSPIRIPAPCPAAMGNDLEASAVRLYPSVGEALNILRPFGAPRMSGSGGSVFVAATDRMRAKASVRQLRATLPRDWQCFAVRVMNTHPHAAP